MLSCMSWRLSQCSPTPHLLLLALPVVIIPGFLPANPASSLLVCFVPTVHFGMPFSKTFLLQSCIPQRKVPMYTDYLTQWRLLRQVPLNHQVNRKKKKGEKHLNDLPCFRVGLLTIGARLSLTLLPAVGFRFPLPRLSAWASVGEGIPSPRGTRCPRVRWFPREGGSGGGICKNGTGK